MIGLINYGSGNFKSVSNILKFLDINFKEIKFEKDFKDKAELITLISIFLVSVLALTPAI